MDSKNANKNQGTLGHLYYYKDYNEKSMVPDSMIMEESDESGAISMISSPKQTKTESSSERLEKIMEELAFLPESSE